MKILYVINHMDWFWSHRLPLAQGAQSAGYNVTVAAAGASGDKNLAKHKFTGAELPAEPVPLIIPAIHRIIKNQKPDIIHAVTLKYAFMAGLAARLHKDIKIVHTIAGLGYLFSGES